MSALPANILVVSDLHFGEELLPGASVERRQAVELGASAFCEFLRYHAARRLGGRPWRLVIAGDLFDFMSVVVASTPPLRARNADERRHGIGRSSEAGVVRMRAIGEAHREPLCELARFAGAGHRVDILAGNHDVELLDANVIAELVRQLRESGASDAALERIAVVPWFVYEPGTAWIEHGHVYDEGCSFEYNLSPTDPRTGQLLFNIDYAAVRYLATASPQLDPHAIEDWSLWGFLRYGWDAGMRKLGSMWAGYARFAFALIRARAMHQSFKGRDARRRAHRERLADAAAQGGVSLATASAIDRLARTPMTTSWRRLGRMLMLDKFGVSLGTMLLSLILLIALPFAWSLLAVLIVIGGAAWLSAWLGKHTVTSQLPMRAVPHRLTKLVDAPAVIFGHTHDPRWQPLPGGGVYVNAGTWLPATRPGLRRSFTHVLVQPRPGSLPVVELRQWRNGTSEPFDARADLGAGVTAPGLADAVDWRNAAG